MLSITRRDLLRSTAISGLAIAAPLLLSEAALAHAEAVAEVSEGALPVLAPREKYLMDFGWKFQFGNSVDPAKDLGFGNGQGDFAKTGEFDFAKVTTKCRILTASSR